MSSQLSCCLSAAELAEPIARSQGLGFSVYSIASIMEAMEPGETYLETCCRVTETPREGQLKFAFTACKENPKDDPAYLTISVITHTEKLNKGKLNKFLQTQLAIENVVNNVFSSEHVDPRDYGLVPGLIGFVPDLHYFETDCGLHLACDKLFRVEIPYIINNSILDQKRICFPIGKGLTDELAVLSAPIGIGDRMDRFLQEYLNTGKHYFAEIGK